MDLIVVSFIFLLIGWLIFWLFLSRKAFYLEHASYPGPLLQGKDTAMVFIIVLGVQFIALFFGSLLLQKVRVDLQMLNILLQICIYCVSFILFGIYFSHKKRLLSQIIYDEKFPGKKSFSQQLWIAMMSYIVAFFLVSGIGSIIDWILEQTIPNYSFRQNALTLLGSVDKNSLAFLLISLSAIVLAPVYEEFIFRGILQTWLRKVSSSKTAIVIASMIFAAFHYSSLQGYSNISLCLSLFVFSLFLGFCYEKTRCLFSSIILHVTFNFINVMRILYLE